MRAYQRPFADQRIEPNEDEIPGVLRARFQVMNNPLGFRKLIAILAAAFGKYRQPQYAGGHGGGYAK